MTSGLSTLRRHPTAALLTAAGTLTAIATFDLAANPAHQGALHTYKEYVLTATLIPATFVVLWVLAALQALGSAPNDRYGRNGLRVAAVGVVALVIDGVVTLASGTTDTTGPLYPIAIIATLIGVVLMAIEWHRAGVLPRWTGPTLAIGWFLGASPILGSGAAFLILAAAFLAIAFGLRRQTAAQPEAPVRLSSSIPA